MNIGLTGGIASGKSFVSSLLVGKGALLIDADAIAREVVEPGSATLARVAERFGADILHPDGSLNRKKLGSIIFADPQERQALESLLHPPIRALMRSRMEQYAQDEPDKLVVVDVPLLYESGLEWMFDKVMVVYVPRSVQLARLMERDGLDRQQAEQRLHSQMDIEAKRERADYVIDNSGTRHYTEEQVDLFWNERGLS